MDTKPVRYGTKIQKKSCTRVSHYLWILLLVKHGRCLQGIKKLNCAVLCKIQFSASPHNHYPRFLLCTYDNWHHDFFSITGRSLKKLQLQLNKYNLDDNDLLRLWSKQINRRHSFSHRIQTKQSWTICVGHISNCFIRKRNKHKIDALTVCYKVSFFFLRFRDDRISIEKDMPPDEDAKSAVSLMNTAQIVMIIITILLSVLYVLSKMSTENVTY